MKEYYTHTYLQYNIQAIVNPYWYEAATWSTGTIATTGANGDPNK